jgi:hypothetical protein
MKRAILIYGLVLITWLSGAQSWNPYVCEGKIGSTYVLPKEFDGKGEVFFRIGNTGNSSIAMDGTYPANNLTLVISFSRGIPDRINPLASLKGSWAGMFDWTYDASANTFTGLQNCEIPGDSQGEIILGFNVAENSTLEGASNGFKIALKTPAYMKGLNSTQDDMASSYTFTKALDFGDAPESYGEASHEINLNKEAESGLYTRYLVLGKVVDPDRESKFSPDADGDDVKENDDEDGVTIPPLTAGGSFVVPVFVTVHDQSYGFLNAWFDWNGDGDFNDAGEKVTVNPIVIFNRGTYNLPITVPSDAVTKHPVFARFRIGANGGPNGNNSWGEVEDYQVMIKSAELETTKTELEGDTLTSGNLHILVYPNPVIDKYYVSIDRKGSYRLELINDLGEVVLKRQADMLLENGIIQLTRGALVSGSYFLRITAEKGHISKTVNVQMVDKPYVRR